MSVIATLRAQALRIPFRMPFKHASAERHETASVLVEAVTDSSVGYGESCPRPYVTDETVASALAFCEAHRATIQRDIVDLDTLRTWVVAHEGAIDRHPAAWCAIELAIVDALSRRAGQSAEAWLGLPALGGVFRYSAVIGDMAPAAFEAMAARYAKAGFADFKLKLSGDEARNREKVEMLTALPINALRIRADANNVWPDAPAALRSLSELAPAFWALEEPVSAGDYAALAHVATTCARPVVLDESVVRRDQLARLPGAPSQWIVNVRVSKMGGVLRSLDVVREARARGFGVIVGAQVGETSILTRAAWPVAQAAGPSLLAQEGAFGTELLEHDIVEAPLMFGAGGMLASASAPISGCGFGFAPVTVWR